MSETVYKRQWQDVFNFILGFWLVISPWVLGYANTRFAVGNSVIMGIATLIFSSAALIKPDIWQEFMSVMVGFLTMISPVTVGYTEHTTAVEVSVIAGLVLTIDGLTGLRRRFKEQQPGINIAAGS